MTDHEAVLRTMTQMLKARQWDAAPGLYLLHAEADRAWVRHRSVLPDRFWRIGPPAEVLARAAEALREQAGRPGLGSMMSFAVANIPTFTGLVFCCDIRFVRVPPGDADRRKVLEQAARDKRLREHPETVDGREAWAILRDGARLTVIQERGQPAPRPMQEVRGDIVTALEAILRNMTTAGAN